MEEKKKSPAPNDPVFLPDEMLKKSSGGNGGFGDDIPRTPEYSIDEDAEKKFS